MDRQVRRTENCGSRCPTTSRAHQCVRDRLWTLRPPPCGVDDSCASNRARVAIDHVPMLFKMGICRARISILNGSPAIIRPAMRSVEDPCQKIGNPAIPHQTAMQPKMTTKLRVRRMQCAVARPVSFVLIPYSHIAHNACYNNNSLDDLRTGRIYSCRPC